MITADDIRDLRTVSADYQETESIKALLAAKRERDGDLYLTLEDFQRIVQWKLRQQLGRANHLLIQNTSALVEQTTRLALSAQIDDPDYEFQFRFSVLTTLRGVGTGVASAILALAYPEKYCVVDYRGWRQVFRRNKTMFTLADYRKYLFKVLKLAKELQWPPQEVDFAIWEFDKRNRNRRA